MSRLYEVSNIGHLKLNNRFIRSGTWMRKATEDGYLTPDLTREYKKLAEANLGMVIAGYSRVNEFERANNCMIGMYDDKFIPDLQKFTKMFHDNNTLVGIQIAMGGTQVHYDGEVDWQIMSPSPAIVKRRDTEGNEVEIKVPEMTVAQIEAVINDFVAAARRVQQSGFDMVQLHAGHGYFISQWMNPELNRRNDEYGLDRPKFILDLYNAVRTEVGPDYPIGIKINSEEQIGDDSNHQSMLELCMRLDELGIDLIEVSGCAPSRTNIRAENESYFKSFGSKLANKVSCPIMLTGGNKRLNKLEALVTEVGIDFIGLSRPLISEPNLIKKWNNDPSYELRCVACNHCHRVTYQCVFDK